MKRIYLVDAVFALMVTLAAGKVSRGDTLDVTLSQSSQTVNRGTTIVTFDATISNPSATDTIFLNADDSSTDSFSMSVDDTPFFVNAPLFLGPTSGQRPLCIVQRGFSREFSAGYVYRHLFHPRWRRRRHGHRLF